MEPQVLKAILGLPLRQQKERSSMERHLIIGINLRTFYYVFLLTYVLLRNIIVT